MERGQERVLLMRSRGKGGRKGEGGKEREGGRRMQAIETKHFGKKTQTFEGTGQLSFDAKREVNTGKIAG